MARGGVGRSSSSSTSASGVVEWDVDFWGGPRRGVELVGGERQRAGVGVGEVVAPFL